MESAQAAGLRYVSDTMPGIRRKKAGKGFTYAGLGTKKAAKEILSSEEVAVVRLLETLSR